MSNVDLNPLGGPPVSFTSSSFKQNAIFQNLPQATQNSLIQTWSVEELNALFPAGSPSLTPPTASISSFFTSINDPSVEFRQQLDISAFVDQLKRRPPVQSAAIQAAILGNLFTARSQVVETSKKQAADATTKFKTDVLDQVQSETNAEQALIETINAENANEQARAQQQLQDYQTYINYLKNQLGAVDNGDGTYTIPAGINEADTANKINNYNAAAQTYNQQTASFNDFTTMRKNALAAYNNTTHAYNQTAAQNNQAINNFINQYNLANYIANNHLPSMLQPTANERDIGQMTLNGAPTTSISTLPLTIQVGTPPDWVKTSANQVPRLPTVSYTELTDQQVSLLQTGVYQSLYKMNVTSYDNQTQTVANYWAYLNMLDVFRPVVDSTPDPLLNHKKIGKKLLPDALNPPNQPINTQNAIGGSELAVQVIGLGSPRLESLLSKALLSQTIHNSHLNLTDQQVQELTNQTLLLTTSLLGANSLQSLFPSLGPLANRIESLPANSPAYSLSFSISFANRAQELTQNGLTSIALQTFLNESSLVAHLNEAQKTALATQLTPIVNLSLMLVSAKLLEANLGLPGLVAQLLPSLLPSNTFTADQVHALTQQAFQGNQQTLNELRTQIETYFTAQGLEPDKAQLFAQLGTDLASQSLLAPSVTSLSKDTVQVPLLTNSVVASLLFAQPDLSLDQAKQIATQSVNQTLDEGPFPSLSQFNAALETNLRNRGLGKESTEIVAHAIALPPEEQISLNQTSAPPQLSQNELLSVIEKKALDLLTPQIGVELARQISSELAKTLFGTPNPDTADRADIKSPYSLVSITNHEIDHLNIQQDQQYANAISTSFKESIEKDVRVDKFLESLMYPSSLYAYTGLMYAGHEPSSWKKSIDILI